MERLKVACFWSSLYRLFNLHSSMERLKAVAPTIDNASLTDLHSSMERLKDVPCKHDWLLVNDLHSSMERLKAADSLIYITAKAFTFQYGEIKRQVKIRCSAL